MDVRTLHFLVHPGFHPYMDLKWMGRVSPIMKGRDDDLLAVYREKIASLGDGDVLVLFTPPEKELFKSELKSGGSWLDLAKDAKTRLGKRCVVLSDPDFLDDPPKTGSVDKLRAVLKVRNFNVGDSTSCEVWGFSAEICATITAAEVFKQLPLKNYPIIPAKATNLKDRREEDIRGIEAELRKNYPKTTIVNRL